VYEIKHDGYRLIGWRAIGCASSHAAAAIGAAAIRWSSSRHGALVSSIIIDGQAVIWGPLVLRRQQGGPATPTLDVDLHRRSSSEPRRRCVLELMFPPRPVCVSLLVGAGTQRDRGVGGLFSARIILRLSKASSTQTCHQPAYGLSKLGSASPLMKRDSEGK
jgi:hypothetical protein